MFLEEESDYSSSQIFEEDEDINDEASFYDCLIGKLAKLPHLFNISQNLMSQILDYYFYDVTEIGRLFATDNGRQEILSQFGIPESLCKETLRFCNPENLTCEMQCQLCKQTYNGSDMMCLICGHFFCINCWIKSIKSGHLECLHDDCNCRITYRDVNVFCPDLDMVKYHEFSTKILHQNIKMKLLIDHPYIFNCPECGHEMNFNDSIFGNVCCRDCKKAFCMKCHKESHLPLTCEQYSEFNELVKNYSNKEKEFGRYKEYHKNKHYLNREKQIFASLMNFGIGYDNSVEFCENIKKNVENGVINLENVAKIYNIEADDNYDIESMIKNESFLVKYKDIMPIVNSTYKKISDNEVELNKSILDISELISGFEKDKSLEEFLDDSQIIFDKFNHAPEIIDFNYEDEVEFDIDSDSEDHQQVKQEDVIMFKNQSDQSLPPIDNVFDEPMKQSMKQYFEGLEMIKKHTELAELISQPTKKSEIDQRQFDISIQFHMAKIIKAYREAFFHYNKHNPNYEQLKIIYKKLVRQVFAHSNDREIDLPYYIIQLYNKL